MTEKRGNWTDAPCFYVTSIDGPRVAFVAGPFQEHGQALGLVDKARKLANALDPKSWFYGWGTARRENGYKEGVLNGRLGI